MKSVKPKLGPGISERVHAAVSSNFESIKSLYKVRTEMRAAIHNILKVVLSLNLYQILLKTRMACYRNVAILKLIIDIFGLYSCTE